MSFGNVHPWGTLANGKGPVKYNFRNIAIWQRSPLRGIEPIVKFIEVHTKELCQALHDMSRCDVHIWCLNDPTVFCFRPCMIGRAVKYLFAGPAWTSCGATKPALMWCRKTGTHVTRSCWQALGRFPMLLENWHSDDKVLLQDVNQQDRHPKAI